MAGSKHSCIYSIQSLLSVQPFSLSDIRSPGSNSGINQLSFHFLPFKMTNNSNCRPVVPLASINDAHFRFPAWFIKAYFWYLENTTLELHAILIIYLFSSILYVFSSRIPYYALMDRYWLNQSCIISRFWARNLRVRLYLACNVGWRQRNLETQFFLNSL